MSNLSQFLLFILCNCCFLGLNAQEPVVYTGNIILTRQSQVDSFPLQYPGVTYLDGILQIGYTQDDTVVTDIADLSPLHSLRYISNTLSIVKNPRLHSLQGLEQIDTIFGYLLVYYNDSLVNLEGLHNLKRCGIGIEIAANDGLQSTQGLYNLQRAAYVFVGYNKNLETITDLQQLNDCYDGVIIRDNARLKTVTDFTQLNRCLSISIHKNDSLESIGNFNAYRDGADIQDFPYIYIASNPLLAHIGDFPQLDSASSITIAYSPLLRDTLRIPRLKRYTELRIEETGLKKVEFGNLRPNFFNDTYIRYNDSLADLHFLHGLTRAYSLDIIGNASLPDLKGLDSLQQVYFLTLYSNQPALTSLAGLNKLTNAAAVKIDDNWIAQSVITDISALGNLTTLYGVDGPYGIFELCCKCPIDHALRNLRSIGNSALFSSASYINDCDSLAYIGQGLTISCDSIVTGFNHPDLDSLRIGVSFAGHLGMQHIDAFKNLKYIGKVLSFYHQHQLDTITGLNNLQQIYDGELLMRSHEDWDSLAVIDPHGLSSIDCFSNITRIGTLDNGYSILIKDFPNLTDCSALCDIHLHADLDGPIVVENNPFPCNSLENALVYCDTVSAVATPQRPDYPLGIAPNPSNANGDLLLTPPADFLPPFQVQVSDVSGSLLFTTTATQRPLRINIQGLGNGAYVATVTDAQWRQASDFFIVEKQ